MFWNNLEESRENSNCSTHPKGEIEVEFSGVPYKKQDEIFS